MSVKLAIIPILLAGIMNGSFIVPTKYIKQLSHERIWFFHSIIGIFVLPWLALVLIQPHIIPQLLQLPGKVLFYSTLSGLLFGMGQIAFAYSIAYIGIGLSFAINLGLGMALGSMFVMIDQHAMLSWHGFIVSAAILLILLGLTINYYTQKHDSISPASSHHFYRLGWILAIIVGLTSGLQNITFVVLAVNHSALGAHANPFWIWPPFLTAAALPMLIGFWYRNRQAQIKNKLSVSSLHNKIREFESGHPQGAPLQATLPAFNKPTLIPSVLKMICPLYRLQLINFLLIFMMGLFFVGSLVLYSEGMYTLPRALHVIGWPLFMVLIIFTSQAWGWIYHEFRDRRGMIYSSIFFLLAILMLATMQ